MLCQHHYQYTQGYFFCTKCGHKRYSKHTGRRNSRKRIAIPVIIVLVGIAFFIYSDEVLDFTRQAPEMVPDVPKIAQDVRESIQVDRTLDKVTNEADSVPEPVKTAPKDTKTNVVQSPQPKEPVSRDYLYSIALGAVNADRAKNGLSPVMLSDNPAAQVHADDVLKMRTISHWMTNGEKPYMTYTRYGGTGNVGQNVAFGGYLSISECSKSYVICDPIEPVSSIKESHYSMVYDDASSGWGHRDNILDPRHTHVSFGFAYDQYSYAFVQNFEDNYIDFVSPIGNDPHNVRIIGNTIGGKMSSISIYYDQYPEPYLYGVHKNDGSYGLGDLVAVVVPPLPPNTYYEQPGGYSLIIAKSMSQNGNAISASFDMSSVVVSRGVYTITIWLQDGNTDIPATSYAMFVE